jgi:hypothetical protein
MATEKRLIDANKLLENSDVFTMHTKEYGCIEVIPVEQIWDAPTVDAVEVVHGRWNEKQEQIPWCEDDVDTYWMCSVCGAIEIGKTNYCHNCGAKMDGDGNG